VFFVHGIIPTKCPRYVFLHNLVLLESCLQTCMAYTIVEFTVNELL